MGAVLPHEPDDPGDEKGGQQNDSHRAHSFVVRLRFGDRHEPTVAHAAKETYLGDRDSTESK